MSSLAALRRCIGWTFLAAAVLLPLGSRLGRRLPPPRDLLPELTRAPVQEPTDRAPFDFTYKGKRCFVRPVATYELWGLVVSRNDIHSVSDIYHDATSVDTRDLCVVWGRNVASGNYGAAEFWSGPFTCYVRTPDGLELDSAAVGNNHLITDQPELRRALAKVDVGDQVHLRGLLVDYRMEDWGEFWRRTSRVRDDSGCEVIFLEQLDVLARSAPLWRAAARLAKALLAALPVAWLGVTWLEAKRGRSSLGEL